MQSERPSKMMKTHRWTEQPGGGGYGERHLSNGSSRHGNSFGAEYLFMSVAGTSRSEVQGHRASLRGALPMQGVFNNLWGHVLGPRMIRNHLAAHVSPQSMLRTSTCMPKESQSSSHICTSDDVLTNTSRKLLKEVLLQSILLPKSPDDP